MAPPKIPTGAGANYCRNPDTHADGPWCVAWDGADTSTQRISKCRPIPNTAPPANVAAAMTLDPWSTASSMVLTWNPVAPG